MSETEPGFIFDVENAGGQNDSTHAIIDEHFRSLLEETEQLEQKLAGLNSRIYEIGLSPEVLDETTLRLFVDRWQEPKDLEKLRLYPLWIDSNERVLSFFGDYFGESKGRQETLVREARKWLMRFARQQKRGGKPVLKIKE